MDKLEFSVLSLPFFWKQDLSILDGVNPLIFKKLEKGAVGKFQEGVNRFPANNSRYGVGSRSSNELEK